MNGMISDAFVLDTNAVIDFIKDEIKSLPPSERFISVITEMELHIVDLTEQEEEMINDMSVIPFSNDIKDEAVRIRKFGKPRLKLPDAIIAASAVVFDATLLTSDEKMLKLEWDGLRTANPRMVDL